MVEPSLHKQNPALKHLEVFVGDWDWEISKASFLPELSATLHGQASFKWFEDGAFLVWFEAGSKQGFPDGISIIGRDEQTPDYKMLYFDSRGVSRIYEMSFTDGLWKLCRAAPSFSQRFEGQFSDDGNIITAYWENSADGRKWEHDFHITYTRMK